MFLSLSVCLEGMFVVWTGWHVLCGDVRRFSAAREESVVLAG